MIPRIRLYSINLVPDGHFDTLKILRFEKGLEN